MTDTTAEVEAVRAPDLPASGTISLADLARKMLMLTEPPAPAAAAPGFPATVEFTDEVRATLRSLADRGARDQYVPGEARELTAEELVRLTREADELAEAAKALDARQKQLKEIVRVHKDRTAMADHGRRPPRDAKGHFILGAPKHPHHTVVPELGRSWDQDYKSGPVTVHGEQLPRLLDEGMIERSEYLAVTRQVRMLDNARFQEFMVKDPKRALHLLRLITTIGPASSALSLRGLPKDGDA